MAKVIFQDNFLLMGTNYHEKEANKVMAEIGIMLLVWILSKIILQDVLNSQG